MPELIEPALPPSEEPLPGIEPVVIEPVPVEPIAPVPEVSVPEPVIEQTVPVDAPTEILSSTDLRMNPPVSTSPGSKRRLPVSLWFTALLVPYAIVATIALAYLLQQQQRNKAPHILESIPDQGLYEDFLDGRRREVMPSVSKVQEKPSTTKIIPPNEPISQEIAPLKLGETRRVGQLEVTPRGIKKYPVTFAMRASNPLKTSEEALMLTLEVKNVGNIIFRPDDETFNRAIPNEGKAPVYTFLEAGVEPKLERYYGAVSDPTTERLDLPFCEALLPGDRGVMHIVAFKSSDGRKLAIDVLKENVPLLWRVHLRRGKEEVTLSTGKKRSVWLTTVVPIRFTAADVK